MYPRAATRRDRQDQGSCENVLVEQVRQERSEDRKAGSDYWLQEEEYYMTGKKGGVHTPDYWDELVLQNLSPLVGCELASEVLTDGAETSRIGRYDEFEGDTMRVGIQREYEPEYKLEPQDFDLGALFAWVDQTVAGELKPMPELPILAFDIPPGQYETGGIKTVDTFSAIFETLRASPYNPNPLDDRIAQLQGLTTYNSQDKLKPNQVPLDPAVAQGIYFSTEFREKDAMLFRDNPKAIYIGMELTPFSWMSQTRIIAYKENKADIRFTYVDKGLTFKLSYDKLTPDQRYAPDQWIPAFRVKVGTPTYPEVMKLVMRSTKPIQYLGLRKNWERGLYAPILVDPQPITVVDYVTRQSGPMHPMINYGPKYNYISSFSSAPFLIGRNSGVGVTRPTEKNIVNLRKIVVRAPVYLEQGKYFLNTEDLVIPRIQVNEYGVSLDTKIFVRREKGKSYSAVTTCDFTNRDLELYFVPDQYMNSYRNKSGSLIQGLIFVGPALQRKLALEEQTQEGAYMRDSWIENFPKDSFDEELLEGYISGNDLFEYDDDG